MSWEARKGRLYYYKAFRQQGRVVKEYCGRGTAAEEAASEDAARRTTRREQWEFEQHQRQTYEATYEEFSVWSDTAEGMLETALLEAGYHRPGRGPWRKKRAKRKA